MLRAFDHTMDEVVRTRSREADIGQLPQLFTEIGLAVGMALLAAVSFGGGQSQLLFGVFAVAALRLMPSVRGIMSGWATIRYNRYTIPILREAALHEPASAHPEVTTRETLPFEREISVRNLSFSFTEESRELFHGLTLTIRKGERIGIRGASGPPPPTGCPGTGGSGSEMEGTQTTVRGRTEKRNGTTSVYRRYTPRIQ